MAVTEGAGHRSPDKVHSDASPRIRRPAPVVSVRRLRAAGERVRACALDARRTLLAAAVLWTVFAAPAGAQSLQQVVRAALDDYPAIAAASAQRAAATSEIRRAEALHYPVVDMLGVGRVAGTAVSAARPRARVNLWASGGIDAQIERETWREQSARSREVQTREDVAFEAASAYLQTLRSVRLRDAARRNMLRHEQLVADFAAIAEIDRGRRYDLIQARTRAEQVNLQVVDQESAIAAGRESLARYFRGAIDPDALALPDLGAEPSEPTAEARALAEHPAVQAAQRLVQSAEADTRVTRASRLPRLDLESTVGKDSATFLTFTWPAFDLASAAAQEASIANLEAARANASEQERIVAARLRTAWQELLAARRRSAITSGQIQLAEELVQTYREQFRIGRRNLLDLLNAFNELALAEAANASSAVDSVTARLKIEYAAGYLSRRFADAAR